MKTTLKLGAFTLIMTLVFWGTEPGIRISG